MAPRPVDIYRGAWRLLAAFAIAGSLAILAASPRAASPASMVDLRVDPNTATADVLLALPGLGPSRVRAILSAREAAPFRSADELDRRVKGIGPATMAGLAPHLRFDSPTTPGR